MKVNVSTKLSWLIPALVAVLALSFSNAMPVLEPVFRPMDAEHTPIELMSNQVHLGRTYSGSSISHSSNEPHLNLQHDSSSLDSPKLKEGAVLKIGDLELPKLPEINKEPQFTVKKYRDAVSERMNQRAEREARKKFLKELSTKYKNPSRVPPSDNEGRIPVSESTLNFDGEGTIPDAEELGHLEVGFPDALTGHAKITVAKDGVKRRNALRYKPEKETKQNGYPLQVKSEIVSNGDLVNTGESKISKLLVPNSESHLEIDGKTSNVALKKEDLISFRSAGYKDYKSKAKIDELKETTPPKAKTFKDPFSNEMRTEKYVPVRKVDGKQFYRLEGALDDFSGNTPQLYRFVKQKDGKLWTEIYNEGEQSKTLSFSEAHPTKDPSEITKVGVNNKKNAAVGVN